MIFYRIDDGLHFHNDLIYINDEINFLFVFKHPINGAVN